MVLPSVGFDDDAPVHPQRVDLVVVHIGVEPKPWQIVFSNETMPARSTSVRATVVTGIASTVVTSASLST